MKTTRWILKAGIFLAAVGMIVALYGCGSNPVSSQNPNDDSAYVRPGNTGNDKGAVTPTGGGEDK